MLCKKFQPEESTKSYSSVWVAEPDYEVLPLTVSPKTPQSAEVPIRSERLMNVQHVPKR